MEEVVSPREKLKQKARTITITFSEQLFKEFGVACALDGSDRREMIKRLAAAYVYRKRDY